MAGFVYKWTNLLNNKWYIGSHKGKTTDGYTASGVLIRQSFEKHGMDNFVREILYEGPDFVKEEARILTELNAAKDNKSYNMINTASDNFDGYRVSGDDHHMKRPEIAKKVSDAKKGRPNGHTGMKHTEEAKERMRIAQQNRNYTHSDATKAKMRGRVRSEEHKQNLSNSRKGRPWSQARWDAHHRRHGE